VSYGKSLTLLIGANVTTEAKRTQKPGVGRGHGERSNQCDSNQY
jgi:hypothetical protein